MKSRLDKICQVVSDVELSLKLGAMYVLTQLRRQTMRRRASAFILFPQASVNALNRSVHFVMSCRYVAQFYTEVF